MITSGDKKTGWFARLKQGLHRTRVNIIGLFTGGSIDEDFLEELEYALISADMGVQTVTELLSKLRETIKLKGLKTQDEVRMTLRDELVNLLKPAEGKIDLNQGKPLVMMMVGVNGAGKTTSIGKISNQLRQQGKKVVVAAADTFRAAAIDQLGGWCERAGVDMIRQSEGSDPAAVVYDAVNYAKNKQADVLLVDTAGRLHNKKNLMNELAKINRVIERELPGASRENLLVLDATTGQNAVLQAKEFRQAAELSGLILTKLDGTAKGGIVLSIKKELDVPVKFIGVGEKIDDMEPFDADEFVDALFSV